ASRFGSLSYRAVEDESTSQMKSGTIVTTPRASGSGTRTCLSLRQPITSGRQPRPPIPMSTSCEIHHPPGLLPPPPPPCPPPRRLYGQSCAKTPPCVKPCLDPGKAS